MKEGSSIGEGSVVQRAVVRGRIHEQMELLCGAEMLWMKRLI